MTAAEHLEPTSLQAALEYAARGWRVIPIPPGQKHPAIPAWQTAGTTDTDRIKHWYTASPDDGIGIVTGQESGLFVLDIDITDGKAGDDTIADLQDTYAPLPDTYTVVTGSGGLHHYFNWPRGFDIRNSASSALGPGLDIRGTGGQVLAPPTRHPNGNRYTHEASSPHTVADAPGWLIALLTRDPTPTAPRTSSSTSAVGDRPGDLWAAETSWHDLLTGDGWTLHHVDRTGETHWTRPGKHRRDGTSATTGYLGSDVLKIFTSSHPHLTAEQTYTKLGYLAATRHGGDHSAAATHLARNGYRAPGLDLTDFTTNSPDTTTSSTPDAAWQPPTPLPAQPGPPPFPLHTLPEWAQDHAAAAADQVQVPNDLTAMLIIGALSAAITGRADVHVSPNWHEPINLYLVTALRSGAGKSPAEKLCVHWLKRWQANRIEAAMPAVEEARQKLRLAEKRLTEKERSATSGAGTDTEAFEARIEAAAAREAIPTIPRLLADDATPEALAGLLAAHSERMAILSTEADLFDMLIKGKPGQRANINVYLKAWSGDTMIRDRKGGSEHGPESSTLNRPLLTIAITVQPKVLGNILGDDELFSRGFPARFMFSMPTDLIGTRDQSKRFAGTRLPTLDPYDERCTELATRWASWELPPAIRFGTDAAHLFEQFLNEIEPRLHADQDLAALGEWVNKMHGSIARYAGLLHLAEGNSPSTPIGAGTVTRAIELGRYWLGHAVAVAGLAVDRVVTQGDEILEWAATEGRARFTLSEVQKAVRRPGEGLDRIGDYIAPIEHLIEHGWLRPVDNSDWRAQVGVKGSPSPTFALWPECVGKPRIVKESRASRIASMGERESPSPPSPPPTPPLSTRYAKHAVLDAPVDNTDPAVALAAATPNSLLLPPVPKTPEPT